MTVPIQPTVIRQPGLGEQVQKGLAPLLQALMFKQQQQQKQQAIEVQKQQVELQGISQRNLEKQRASQRVFSLMDMFGAEVLDDPSVAAMVQQLGLDPKTLLKGHKERVKTSEDADKAERTALIASLPERLRKPAEISLGLLETGVGKEQAGDMFSLLAAETVDEEAMAELDQQFPEFAKLTTDLKFKGILQLSILQAQARLRLGTEGRREVQQQLDEARLELIKLRTELLKKGKPSLVAAMRVLQLAEDAQNILVLATHPRSQELMAMPVDERLDILLGTGATAAVKRAREILFKAVEQPEQ